MKTVRIIIHGIVQGVFFRSGAQKEAQTLGVNGWIKNTIEGTVECVAQGDDAAVEKFIRWCKAGPTASVVKKVDVKPYSGNETFTMFDVIR